MRYTVYHPRNRPHARDGDAAGFRDGAPARLDVSIPELLERVASCNIDPEAFMAAGDLDTARRVGVAVDMRLLKITRGNRT